MNKSASSVFETDVQTRIRLLDGKGSGSTRIERLYNWTVKFTTCQNGGLETQITCHSCPYGHVRTSAEYGHNYREYCIDRLSIPRPIL